MLKPHAVPLVNKELQRVIVRYPNTMTIAECYQATNVRDESTWVLVDVNVPEKLASNWLLGKEEI